MMLVSTMLVSAMLLFIGDPLSISISSKIILNLDRMNLQTLKDGNRGNEQQLSSGGRRADTRLQLVIKAMLATVSVPNIWQGRR